MPHDIFVSHSTKDKIAADAVVAHLERDGLRCWCAPRDIIPGSSWANSIVQGIVGSKAMVIVFSNHANESDHIRREVERAVSHGIPIVPVRIEDVMPKGDLEYFLSSSHWMDAITPPMERHFDDLASRLRVLLNIAAGPAESSQGSKPVPAELAHEHRPAAKRWIKYAVLGCVGICIAAGLLLWLRTTGGSHTTDLKSANNATGSTSSPTSSEIPTTDAALAADYREWQRLALITRWNSFFLDHAPQRYSAWLRDANAGDPVGQFFVGHCYLEGIAVRKDEKGAFDWFMKAAQQRNADAMVEVAYCLQIGQGVKRDQAEAYRWATDAADMQNVPAFVFLGALYDKTSSYFITGNLLSEPFVKPNDRIASTWYQKASDLGSGDAALFSGRRDYFDDKLRTDQTGGRLELAAQRLNPIGVSLTILKHQKKSGDKSAATIVLTHADAELIEAALPIANARLLIIGAGMFGDQCPKIITRLRHAADIGSVDALEGMGDLYRQGSPPQYAEAIRWYSKAGEAGDSAGFRSIGDMYESGAGVPIDVDAAIGWWTKAGETQDFRKIAEIYFDGKRITRNVPLAIQFWIKAGEREDFQKIGQAYADGNGIEQSVQYATDWWTKSGDFWEIGELYVNGTVKPPDPDTTVKWWTKAAEIHAYDAANLGDAYHSGTQIPKDDQQALLWYSRSADAGNSHAQTWVAAFYRDGIATKQDYNEAVRWFLKAAGADDDQAMKCMANMFSAGLGVPQNLTVADHWNKLAENTFDATSQMAVANDLKSLPDVQNTGEEEEIKKAEAHFYKLAAIRGSNPVAMRELAKLLDDNVRVDDGGSNDPKEWWTKAADAGDAEALKHLGRTN